MNIIRIIPIFLIMIGAVLTISITLFKGFSFNETYIRIAFVVPVFYVIGIIISHLLNRLVMTSWDKRDINQSRLENSEDAVNEGLGKENNEDLGVDGGYTIDPIKKKGEDFSDTDPIAFKRVKTKQSLNTNRNTLEK